MPYYSWNFGDGNFSTAYNPTHVYLNTGTYTVCLTLWDSMNINCQSTYCDSVTILSNQPPPCTANFMALYDSLNSTMNFYNFTMGNPIAWYWDFGDGDNSSLQNPTHSYSTP